MKEVYFAPQKKRSYVLPTHVYFGRRTSGKIAKIIVSKKIQKVIFVVGEHLKNSSLIHEILSSKAYTTVLYPVPIKKSDIEVVSNLIEFVRKDASDAVIGIGGGAILDSAKCAAILSVHPGNIGEYLQGRRKITHRGLPFIAIPTTAGTGSEVTPWATVWGKHKKFSLSDHRMFASCAIVDPQLTDSLPSSVTAESGIDALCQAVEAYWNVHHNETSDKYALQAIEVIRTNLATAVQKPTKHVRDQMAWGSLLGGLAFSNTQTTICHAVSYPMTIHWGIPHGQATAITLPLFMRYTVATIDQKRREKLLKAFGVVSEEKAAYDIEVLIRAIGLKTKLSHLGLTKKNLSTIVKEGFHPDRAKNAPRIPTKEELYEMLLTIL